MRSANAMIRFLYFMTGFTIITVIACLASNSFKSFDGKNEKLATVHGYNVNEVQDIETTASKKTLCPFKVYSEAKTDVYEAHDNKLANIPGRTFDTVNTYLKPIVENTKHRLNPDRFLLVIPRGGPNNQIFEFREAVFIAIKLNRTLVLPKFFKHFTDSGRGATEYVHPSHRIQVDYFCKFVPCVTIDRFRETCHNEPDGVIRLHDYKKKDFENFERYIDMKIPRDGVTLDDRISVPKIKPTSRMIFSDKIENLLKTDARCLIYPYALFNLRLNRSKITFHGKKRQVGDRFSGILPFIEPDSSDIKLLRAISRKTRNPFYITRLARNYISSRFGKRQFLTVHWRFEEKDTLKRCRWELENIKNGMHRRRINFCHKALNFNATDLADVIVEKMNKIKNATNISDICFASPPSEKKRIADASTLLREKYGFNAIPSEDIEKYVRTRYSSCETLVRHFNDIVSTTEMEICSRGTVFLSSAGSTWSLNVKHLRMMSGLKTILVNLDEVLFK